MIAMNYKKDINYFSTNIKLLKLAGFIKLKRSANFIQAVIHYTWRIIILFSLCFTFIAVINDIINNSQNDFGEGVFSYAYLGCLSFTITKTCYYYYCDDSTENFINAMNKTFKYRSEIGFEEKNTAKVLNITKRISVSWFWLTFFLGNSFLTVPFLLNNHTKKILPIPAWYPYSWEVSPYYELTVLSQVFNQILTITIVTPTDLFYATTCLLVAKQFEILGWEIQNIFYSNLFRFGISKEDITKFRDECNDSIFPEDRYKVDCAKSYKKQRNFSDIYMMESKTFQDNLLKQFHDLVKFHQLLLSVSDIMVNFFSPVFLLYFVPVSMCFMAFAYTLTTTNDLVIITENSTAVSWLLLEVLLLGYFAEIITEKSEDVRNCLYNLPWYYCDKRFKSSLNIMQLRTIRPVTLTVGKFTNLGLNMFVWTVKTSYSITTLLRNMNQSDRT